MRVVPSASLSASHSNAPLHENLKFQVLVDGVSAGFAGTTAMSALMLLNDRFLFVAQTDLVTDLRRVIYILTGWKPTFLLGWLFHLIFGSYVLGCSFAVLSNYLGGRPAIRGLLFGFGIWLLQMVTAFPVLGYGLFGYGSALGPTEALASLALNLVYGLVLGLAFDSVHVTRRPRYSMESM